MSLNPLSKPKNILPETPLPPWTSTDIDGSLQRLNNYVESEAQKAIRWYIQKKGPKAFLSGWVRLLAIGLTSVAGILPIALNLFGGGTGAQGSGRLHGIESGLLASLLLGLAAGLVGLDRFFGYSSGWIRYVVTATAMQGALEDYRMDWQIMSAHLATPPSSDQVLALLERAKSFRAAIAGMVLDETKSWAAEFQNNLAQLEKDVKAEFAEQRLKMDETLRAQKAATTPGSIELKVSNALSVDNRSFTVSVERSNHPAQAETVTGAVWWSMANVEPGQCRLLVSAMRAGVSVQVSRIVRVIPGEVATIEMELP